MKTTTGLKMLLKSHSMTQGELAERLGVSQATVSHWSTGKIKMPKEVQDEILNVVKSRTATSSKVNTVVHKQEQEVESIPVKSKTLEGKIKECKKFCAENYGFEVFVVGLKK